MRWIREHKLIASLISVSYTHLVFLAALLFGFLDALGLRLQSIGIPSDLTSTLPYIATILMLVYVVVSSKNKKKKKAQKQLKISEST